jgi:hypothetical protein
MCMQYSTHSMVGVRRGEPERNGDPEDQLTRSIIRVNIRSVYIGGYNR